MIAQWLTEQGYPLAIIGAPSDQEEVLAICNRVTAQTGRTPFPVSFPSILGAAVCVEQALLLVTPDTSMIHIASAQTCPVVGIYPGNGNIPGWGPRDVPYKTLQAPKGTNAHTVPAEAITDAISALLHEIHMAVSPAINETGAE